MFNRVFKQKNGSGINTVAPAKSKNRQLRASKSFGDMSLNMGSTVESLAVNLPSKVELDAYSWKDLLEKREAKERRVTQERLEFLERQVSKVMRNPHPQLKVDVIENVDKVEMVDKIEKVDKVEKVDVVAKVEKVEKPVVDAGTDTIPKHTSKRSPTKRVTKRDTRRIVLEKFETLASTNPKFKNFLECYPDYLETLELDELRETEYSRLDKLGQVYLDYTGGSLYPESLVRRHADILAKGVYGNPHSSNPTSSASTAYEIQVRKDILEFFGASPDEYDVILTPNASGALKLVGESYPFSPSRKLVISWDAHNSVNGIREFARRKGSEVKHASLEGGDIRISKESLKECLDNGGVDRKDSGLFVLTGQSNVTGVKTDLSWVKYAKSRGWDVMLDASALAPTTPIDLAKYPVDYMAISFYKMFGYPTGMGCLLMRKDVEDKMVRPWFGGGTVVLVSITTDDFTNATGHQRFEDGTVNYLSFPAVSLGLAFLRSIQKTLYNRVNIFTNYLIKELSSLRHPSGSPLVTIAGPKTTHLRGGTISFYFTDANGSLVSHLLVEAMAKKRGISLRTGCLCNPGATIVAINRLDVVDKILGGRSVEEFVNLVGDGLSLLLRISVGIATNWEDCDAALRFFADFVDPVLYEAMKTEFGDVKITSLC